MSAPQTRVSGDAAESRSRHVDDLLGAYLVGACDPDESAVVEIHLGLCAQCLTAAETLGNGLAQLVGAQTGDGLGSDEARFRVDESADEPVDAGADQGELAGAAGIEALMAAALHRRPAAPTAPEIARPYVTQVAAVDRLLTELSAGDWEHEVVNGWNAREIVAHLAASDGLVAAGIGLSVDPPVHSTDLDERTAAVHDHQRGWTAARTRRAWHDGAEQITDCLRALFPAGGPPADIGNRNGDRNIARLHDYLTARAFETWIHGRDIAEQAGLCMPPPPAEDLHRMADAAIRRLNPKLRAVLPAVSRDATLAVNLSGAGGGRWLAGPDGIREITGTGDTVHVFAREDSHVDAELSAHILGFCLLIADRTLAADLDAELEGDIAVAQAMLAVAPSLAGP